METIEFSKSVLNSSQSYKFSAISLDAHRTISVTARVQYHASGTGAMRVNLYFSADGIHFDTIAYTYFDVPLTAGSTQQRTGIVDIPENGYMQIAVQNIDASYSQTNIQIWVTQKQWKEGK